MVRFSEGMSTPSRRGMGISQEELGTGEAGRDRQDFFKHLSNTDSQKTQPRWHQMPAEAEGTQTTVHADRPTHPSTEDENRDSRRLRRGGDLRLQPYPCRCLCRGSAHTTNTTPRRRTILHFSHMRRTLARTFIREFVATADHAFNLIRMMSGKLRSIGGGPLGSQGGPFYRLYFCS